MSKTNSVFSTIFWLFLFSCISFASAQLTPEMVIQLNSISRPEISPDGKYVAYLKIIPAKEDEGKKYRYSELNIMEVQSKDVKLIKLIYSKSSVASRYQWSGDSKSLYFTAIYDTINPKRQIYRIAVDSDVPELISDHQMAISNFEISQDENKIIFISKKKKTKKEQAKKDNGFDWIINEKEYNFNYLYTLNIKSGKINKISPDSLHVFNFVLEPNGKNIIYQAAKQSNSDYSYMFRDIYRLSIDGQDNNKLLNHDGKLAKMEISPDGKYLAFLGAVDISDPTDGSLLVSEIDKGTWTNYTQDFKGSLTDIDWIDNQSLLFCAETFNHTSVYQVDIVKNTEQKIFGEGLIFKSVNLANDKNTFVCAANEYSHPNELFIGDIKNKRLNRLTHSNIDLENIDFNQPEVFKWKARDGYEIQGVVIRPKSFKADATAPLYIYVHGGPEGARQTGWNNRYNCWPQIFAQKGFVVFIPNYRGSTGRGVDFAKGDHGDMMGVDFDDVLDGLQTLIDKKWVNPEKVGIAGGSYGGYMAAWAATKHSDKFAAAVMFAGISNQISKIGTTDTPHENSLVHWNGYAWETNFELQWDRSPLKYFKNHHTPLLIAHGIKDERVPAGQSFELFRALNHRDQAPVKLIIYPDEKHGLKMRSHRYHYMISAINWLEKYLLGD